MSVSPTKWADCKLSARLIALCFGVAAAAHASLIVLTPTSVIGGSGSYNGPVAYNAGSFPATNIFDTQVGTVGDNTSGYWLNTDLNEPATAYITIDLGQAYSLSSMQLFNTHNRFFEDRGTGSFLILAGNSVTFGTASTGYRLSGATTTIVSGTLLAVGSDPISGQSFSVGSSNAYRYLEFRPTGEASVNPPCCAAGAYGLNEMRVFASDVPEPGSFTLAGIGGLILCCTGVWRRITGRGRMARRPRA